MKKVVLAAVIALLCSCEREKEDDFNCANRDKWSQVGSVSLEGFEDDCEEWKRMYKELKQRVEEDERKNRK